MALTGVVITPEVFLTMLTHALTTEAEEIMGLLLGDIRAGAGDAMVAHIRRAVPQIRTDRRKDRVETSPEQMAACSALAEHISSATGVPTRVVGWYHSHPHITVLPSHVDVNTQAMYQMLDGGFVGLICSVFNQSAATKEQTIQLTAFQAVPGGTGASGGPGGSASALLQLQSSASAELEGLDAQMQAALAASAAEQQEAAANSWQRREVPLSIVGTDSSNPSTLSDYVEVQKMLLAEEEASHKAGSSGGTSSQVHAALLQLLDAAEHQQALLQHAECVLAPALAAMQQLHLQQELQAQQLLADNQQLKELLAQRTRAAAAAAATGQPEAAPGSSSSAGEGGLISLDDSSAPSAPPVPVDLLS